MKETPPSKGKGDPNLFYCCPTEERGGPRHAPDCDGRFSCVLQLQCKQKTKDGEEVKHQDHFRCTKACGYCGKRRHYEDECHIIQNPKNHTKAEVQRKYAGKGNPEGGGRNPGGPSGKGNPGRGQRPFSPHPGGRGTHNPTPKGEQRCDKLTVPSTPSAGGAEKGDNTKKRKLSWHSKCLPAAGV